MRILVSSAISSRLFSKIQLQYMDVMLPHYGDLFLCLGTSKITSDFIVDRLEELWQNYWHPRFPLVTTLVLNMDNGPENHSRRTQFINRLVGFVAANQVTVQLAYYPPYHSKYNPIEHCWGCLERSQA